MKIINHSNVDYIFQLGYGYWKAEVLFAGVEFDIFTLLNKCKLTSKDISKSIKANKRATEMLLDALVSLALLDKQSNYYKNSEISNMYLVKGSPYYLGDSIHHFHNIMENWSMLRETVETGKPVSIKELPEDVDPHDLRDFITAMHNIASVRTEEFCKKVNLKKSETLLDVAGGPGTYAIALAKAYPHLQATIFDLEQVTKLTQEFIKSAGLEDRVFTQAGNCLEDSLGKDKYDAILISNLLHIYNPKNNIMILKKCWNALKKGGQIIIHEFVLDKTRTKPQFAALFSLNMLIGTQEGASYTEPDYKSWLKNTGFKGIKKIDLKINSSLIIGKK